MKKRWMYLVVLGLITLGLWGCGTKKVTNLTKEVPKGALERPEQEAEEPTEEERQQFEDSYYDFAVELLKESRQAGEGNLLVSPLSVLTALTMTENGAAGETLTQMEEVLAGGMDLEAQNRVLTSYLRSLPEGKKAKLHRANSIWFNTANENIAVSEEFLAKNKAAYDAEIFRAKFDEGTKKSINQWVDKATEGMIPEIIDKIPEDASMYLVNALAFEAEWREPYKSHQVREQMFINQDMVWDVSMMYSEEDWFLEDETVRGFVKPYLDGYDFVALLPKDETKDMGDYLQELTGERLQKLIAGADGAVLVNAGIPKFEEDFSLELSEPLKAMGIELPFDRDLADFSGMGTMEAGAHTYINRVLHKTYISVFEEGTKAAAATAVEMITEGAAEKPEMRIEEVILDHPFVYAIVDRESKLPVFLGTFEGIDR